MIDGVKASLQVQLGGRYIELEDPTGGYELHKETFGTRSVTHKKIDLESAWLEGTYSQRPLRNNIIEAVSVYVVGQSTGDLMRLQNQLTDAFDQSSYMMRLQIEDHVETWFCQAADYTIETSQELLVARRAIVRAQVPRLPKVMS